MDAAPVNEKTVNGRSASEPSKPMLHHRAPALARCAPAPCSSTPRQARQLWVSPTSIHQPSIHPSAPRYVRQLWVSPTSIDQLSIHPSALCYVRQLWMSFAPPSSRARRPASRRGGRARRPTGPAGPAPQPQHRLPPCDRSWSSPSVQLLNCPCAARPSRREQGPGGRAVSLAGWVRRIT